MNLNIRENISRTVVTEFVLLGFSSLQMMRLPLFCLFLTTYILSVIGNALVILMIQLDPRLHTPMYYFLSNLAWLEMIMITIVIPKMLSLLISERKTISFFGCVVQFTLYFLCGTTEVLLLGVMSIDRFLAICNPLRYKAIMTNHVCMLLMFSCWLGSFFWVALTVVLKFRLPYCGPNIIDHFFCDTGPLIKLVCADTTLVEMVELASSCFTLLSSVLLTIISYLCIMVTVMRMPSAQGRKKAFSTFSCHITVVSLCYGSAIFIYVKPVGSSSMDFDKVATMLNSVVTPLLNPLVYSYRNKVFKDVLKDAVKQIGSTVGKVVD